MAESSNITRERGPLADQFELRAFDDDVLLRALPHAAELYAPVRPLMTAEHYQSFAVASLAHAAADAHAPGIFRVNHRAVAPFAPAQCRRTVLACFISLHQSAIIRSDDLCAHILCRRSATKSGNVGKVSIENDASEFAFRLTSEASAPLRLLEVGWEVARG